MCQTNEYEFSTIREIYERVPIDRLRDCLSELADLLIGAHEAEDRLRENFAADGKTFEGPVWTLGEPLVWIDDAKSDVDFTIKAEFEI